MGLGWPSWAPWAADDPELPEPRPSSGRSSNYGGSGNRSHSPRPGADPAPQPPPQRSNNYGGGGNRSAAPRPSSGSNPAPPASSPRNYPGGARPGLEQYLSKSGFDIPASAEPPAMADNMGLLDQESMKALEVHSYMLNPWERDKTAAAYGGVVDEDQNPSIVGDSYSSYLVTDEGWGQLRPDQQNAIQFNTLLSDAVAADMALQSSAPTERGDYDQRVQAVFGTHGGSDTYAPNTLNLMEGLGVQMRGQDIDEYLSMDRAFTLDEIMNMPVDAAVPEVPNYSKAEPMSAADFSLARGAETGLQLDLAVADLAGKFVADALATQPGWNDASMISGALGLVPSPAETPVGFYPADVVQMGADSGLTPDQLNLDAFYKSTYNKLRAPGSGYTLDSLWMETADLGFTEPMLDDLFNYYWIMSEADDRQGTPTGTDWLPRDEFLTSIGMEG